MKLFHKKKKKKYYPVALFSVGDYDLPRISIPRPTFSHFVSPLNNFSRCFPLLRFPSIISVVTRCSSFSHLMAKKGLHGVCVYFLSDFVVSFPRKTVSFDLSAIHEIAYCIKS